jgi:carboxymethylenebutenolidase
MIEFPGVANPARQDSPAPRTEHGYLATPTRPNGAGVLVLHAWWGLTDGFREIADRLAREGFVALAPDSYGDGRVARTIEEAEERIERLDLARAEQVLLGAVEHLVEASDGSRLGSVGFSLGCGFSLWLARKRPDAIRAAVLFYGTGEVEGGEAPVLCHYAADDQYEAAEDEDVVVSSLESAGRLAGVHRYEGADHWFAESDRPEYNPRAFELAWQRTLDFLRGELLV